jgi:hypothetical protein
MDNNKSLVANQKNSAMSTEKTNQDFNKQKPNPQNPNQISNPLVDEVKENPVDKEKTHEIKEKNELELPVVIIEPKFSAKDHVDQMFKEEGNNRPSAKASHNYQRLNESREEKADAMRVDKSSFNKK